MCFSIPKQIVSVAHNIATLEDGTQVQLGEVNAVPTDYVLVYGNVAVEKIPQKQALKTRRIIHTIDTQTHHEQLS